jgi:hypothetical protein
MSGKLLNLNSLKAEQSAAAASPTLVETTVTCPPGSEAKFAGVTHSGNGMVECDVPNDRWYKPAIRNTETGEIGKGAQITHPNGKPNVLNIKSSFAPK